MATVSAFPITSEVQPCSECSTGNGVLKSTYKLQSYLSSISTADESSAANAYSSDSDEEETLCLDNCQYPTALLLRCRSVMSPQLRCPRMDYIMRKYAELPAWAVESGKAVAEASDAQSTNSHTTLMDAEAGDKCTSSAQSSVAWVPRHLANSESASEKMKRTVRSILNKLTLEKFGPLYEQLATCGLSTPEHMAILMQEVFEKATSQHHFIEMYADLCVRLEADPRLASARGSEQESTSFRHLLLNECQSAFLRLLEPQCSTSATGEEQEGLRRKMALGNVKLVGHLMVRGMLSSRLLIACAESLLRGHTTCPEALESVAALLTVTGKRFESRKDWPYADRLAKVFTKIGELTKDKKVASRSRFLLRDLLELREAGWPATARPAVAKEKPMVLDEVREQANALLPQTQASLQHWSVNAQPQNGQTLCPHSFAELMDCHRSSKLSAAAAPFTPTASAYGMPAEMLVPKAARKTGPGMRKKQESHRAAVCEGTQADLVNNDPRPIQQARVGRVSAKSSADMDAEQGVLLKPVGGKKVQNHLLSQAASPSATKPCQLFSLAQSRTIESPAVAIGATHPVKPTCTLEQASAASAEKTGLVASDAPATLSSSNEFKLKVFRKELSSILKDLSSHRNVALAVGRVREQHVPVKHQSREFVDLLTRAAEETRGVARRSFFAFAAGLAAAESSAFDRAECLKGVSMFFRDVFDSLKEEVPRLPAMVNSEMLPTLHSVFAARDLNGVIPEEFMK